MRRSVSAALLTEANDSSPPRPGSSPPRSAWPECQQQQRGRERGRRRDIHGSLVLLRIATILCILGGCLLFGGKVPESRDKLEVHVMGSSPDACAAMLSSPKVALLFLLKGRMFHGEMWESWLERAAGALPAERLSLKLCDGSGEEDTVSPLQISDACRSQQHLFSLYVHLSQELDAEVLLAPQWNEYTKNVTRVITLWGHHSLVEATRYLLAKAFEDPANERFVLLSETHIPVWDPLSVYRVLTNERRSSINAYPHDTMDLQRWTKRMEPEVRTTDWRKSQQWWTLVRSHVEVVLDDSEIFRTFGEHCNWQLEIGPDIFYHRKCFSDEHYFATLLSIKGVENETIPVFATTTYVEWPPHSAHPRSFQPWDVTSELFDKTFRRNDACPLSSLDQDVLVQTSEESFVRVDVLDGGNVDAICETATSRAHKAKLASLPGECTTFARKFGEETVDAVRSVLKSKAII